MSNVFISYAKEDAAFAGTLAEALQRVGFSVWWDRHIPPGKTWDDVIGRALDAAACVVVLWSQTSIQSRWVREEAERAASRGCLIPVLAGEVDPPLGFGRIQAADLSKWRGAEDDSEFGGLVRAISDLVRPDTSSAGRGQSEKAKPAPESHKVRSKFIWIAALFVVVVAASYFALHWNSNGREDTSTRGRPPEPAPSATPTEWTQTGTIHEGCVKFADPETIVSKGPITKIAVYHGGYIHGILIWYGRDGVGSPHGFTQEEYGIRRTEWPVPEGERITRVEGEIAGNYVSRLRFFTDGGTSSPQFGGAYGKPFVVVDPAKRALRTISGWANLKRSRSYNRAIASMTFQFGGP